MSLPKVKIFYVGALLVLFASAGFTQDSSGGIARVFEHDSGARLYLLPYGAPTENTYLALFENFNDPWDGKVILHHFINSAIHKKYQISVATDNKFRPHKTYVSILDSGRKTLFNGSAVPVVEVYVTSKNDPLYMRQSGTDKDVAQKMSDLYKSQKYRVTF